MNQPNSSDDEIRDATSGKIPLDEKDLVSADESSEASTAHSPTAHSPDSEYPLESTDDTPIVADLVQAELVPTPMKSDHFPNHSSVTDWDKLGREFISRPALDLSNELHNMAAVGGAVGGAVLGLWSLVCALITPYAVINAFLAILLGIYGLSSNRRRLASVGIALGLLGTLMGLMEMSEIVDGFWTQEEF